MELRIDPALAVPVYAQVVEQVRTLIALRALRPGDKLPSVRELAAQVRINRNTAAKAYQLLEAAGVLETRAGQGTFVADGVPPWSRTGRRRRDAVEGSHAMSREVEGRCYCGAVRKRGLAYWSPAERR